MDASSEAKVASGAHKASAKTTKATATATATATGDADASATSYAKRRRHANIYDAVAGLTTSINSGALANRQADPAWHLPTSQQATSRTSVLTPQEALFRQTEAPALFAEYDLYNAHTRLLPNGDAGCVLPSSDLLTGIHAYASTFYEALSTPTGNTTAQRRRGRKRAHFVGQRNINEGSLDETALLAFGVLLEEAGRELLGRRGEMVFTEGQEVATSRGKDGDDKQGTGMHSQQETVGMVDLQRPWNKRRIAKRRRVKEDY